MNANLVISVMGVFLVLVNVASFGLMAWDKSCARRGRRRVPEKTLFLVTACFGGLGGVLGMHLMRHKTRHWRFQLFFPLLLILQVALLVGLFIGFAR